MSYRMDTEDGLQIVVVAPVNPSERQYTYQWDGPVDLKPDDIVKVPARKEGAATWYGRVVELGSDYDGPLTTIDTRATAEEVERAVSS
jgi:hypothetical protein